MSRELRLVIFFVLWMGIVLVFYLIFPPTPPKDNSSLPTGGITQDVKKKVLGFSTSRVSQFKLEISTNKLDLSINELGIFKVIADYKGIKYVMLSNSYEVIPFSLIYDSILNIGDRESILNNTIPFRKIRENLYSSDVFTRNYSLRLERRIEYVSDYIFDIIFRVKNLSRNVSVVDGFSFVVGGPLGPEIQDEYFAYQFLRTGYIENGTGSPIETLGTSLFAGTEKISSKPSGVFSSIWMENRYSIVGIAILDGQFNAEFKAIDKKHGFNKILSLRMKSFVLNPNEERNFKVRVLIGPKKSRVLESFGFGFKNLDEGGWLKSVYDGLAWILAMIYGLVNNWGITIILFAILIKIILEPLTLKSAVSMKRLQLIAPKIKEIQNQYKNDPKTANIKIAELYRVYGANPASGCLPLLLQIPIFISLYNLLSSFIELKNQNFLWISDLTKPDTVLHMKFFEGLLIIPTKLNILPIIMTSISFLQSYLTSSKSVGKSSFNIMWIMPLVFMFIFWNLPSALVLYWTIQSILGVFEQYIVNRAIKY